MVTSTSGDVAGGVLGHAGHAVEVRHAGHALEVGKAGHVCVGHGVDTLATAVVGNSSASILILFKKLVVFCQLSVWYIPHKYTPTNTNPVRIACFNLMSNQTITHSRKLFN